MSKVETNRLKCPGCENEVTTGSGLGGPARDGVIALCGKCFTAFRVGPGLTGHVLTEGEVAALPEAAKDAIRGGRSVAQKLASGTLTQSDVEELSPGEISCLLAAQLSEGTDLSRRIIRLLEERDIPPAPITGVACLQISAMLAINGSTLAKNAWLMLAELVYDLGTQDYEHSKKDAPNEA